MSACLQLNAYSERYNRTVRYDWLGQHLFLSLSELQSYATRWQWFYNHERPDMAIKWLHTDAAYSTHDLILLITPIKNGGLPYQLAPGKMPGTLLNYFSVGHTSIKKVLFD